MSNAVYSSQSEFAAFVGIDWADRKHVWAAQVADSLFIEQGELEHIPEAVEQWAAALARRFPGAPGCYRCGTIAWCLMLHVEQVRAFGVVPGPSP